METLVFVDDGIGIFDFVISLAEHDTVGRGFSMEDMRLDLIPAPVT